MSPLRIWIGYSSDESQAYEVCVKSIKRRSSRAVEIYPIRQDWIRSLGLYWRQREPNAATEFSFSRFLTPCLAGYQGPALFVDTDFIFLADIAELFDLYDPQYAVQCVWHDHDPTSETKMGGLVQTKNYRKNWSSLVIYNAGHPAVHQNLTPYKVNTESGAWLHQFQWLHDDAIGELPKEWNFLVNHTQGVKPKGLHFTDGIKTIHGNKSEYDDLWDEESRA